MMKPKVTWSLPGAPIERVADIDAEGAEPWKDNAGTCLYMYLDESGNLDFKESGTPYFMMTCAVSRRPFIAGDAMRELRYDLLESGKDIEKFHACEDDEEMRKGVYAILESSPTAYRVYTAYVDKKEVPEGERTPEAVYARIFALLVDEVYKSEHIPWVDRAIVITDRLPKDATRRQVAKPLKKYMKEKFQTRHIPYSLLHHDSASDMNLQVADYFCWAVQRELVQGKNWPMDKVRNSFVEIGKASFDEM